jgi:hypothetical protein
MTRPGHSDDLEPYRFAIVHVNGEGLLALLWVFGQRPVTEPACVLIGYDVHYAAHNVDPQRPDRSGHGDGIPNGGRALSRNDEPCVAMDSPVLKGKDSALKHGYALPKLLAPSVKSVSVRRYQQTADAFRGVCQFISAGKREQVS